MFGRRVTLFRLLGFEVRVDQSWIVLAILVTWSLAVGLFPEYLPGQSTVVYWWMGVCGATGFFFSILFHEFCHSLVARRFGLPISGITLFIFGGVAEMNEEPPSARVEFLMAAAGPLSSIVLGALFFGAASFATGPASAVLGYLASINGLLAVFNLVPAFPLDGGRILRAALWRWSGDLARATRIASRFGSGFGIVIMFVGVVNFLRGNLVGGLWQFMIGLFLRSAAEASYRQVLVRKSLQGETVAHFMNKAPVTAPPSITLQELVENYLYRYYFKMFPVMEDGRLIGCITTQRVKQVPREEWGRRTVAEIADQCTVESAVAPDADAAKVLGLMSRTGKTRLMVIEGDRLVGIISVKDILGYLAAKLNSGGEGGI